MPQHPLTANQATLLAAIISAVVSLLVCFLYLKFGPNYQKQIADLASTLTKLLQEHSSIADALSNISAAQTKAKWRPSARIESVPRDNFLILKSDREFKVKRVDVRAPNEAIVAEVEQRGWISVSSTGFRILIPQAVIVKLWNDSPGPRQGWMTGSLLVEVSREDEIVNLTIPFMAKQDYQTAGGTTYAWIKLTG